MTPSLQELADKLGIRLPGSSPEPRPPKERRSKRKAAPAPRPERRKYGTEFCIRGHRYGPHTKKTIQKGKVYMVRYCRTCETDRERARRERMRDG